MTAYYNEIDPFAAAWLRELIKAGQIAPGDVDERDIRDVRPDDLAGYAQCHFFAGIGVWSYALRLAGWPDDRPVWTGSCPCQPFSAAGKGGGFADERHLWPSWFHLVEQCRPAVVLGEQVASKDGLGWLDLVQADMEGAGYAIGALDTCSAGHGAPHIRQRLRFAADRAGVALGDAGCAGLALRPLADDGRRVVRIEGPTPSATVVSGGLADARRTTDERRGGPGEARSASGALEGEAQQRERSGTADRASVPPSGLADADVSLGGQGCSQQRGGDSRSDAVEGTGFGRAGLAGRPGPTNGFWRAADWLFCRDGKWRPVEPRSFPLAYGLPRSMGTLSPELRRLAEMAGLHGKSLARAKKHRVGSLRGYGNAVDAQATAAFIESYVEARAVDLRLTGVSRVADIFE